MPTTSPTPSAAKPSTAPLPLPFDFARHYAQTLAHYTRLAQVPGWKEAAWHEVKALASLHRDYKELPAQLTQAVQAAARRLASAA